MSIIMIIIIIQNVLEIYNNVLNTSNTPGWMELQEVNITCDMCQYVTYCITSVLGQSYTKSTIVTERWTI